MGRKRLGAKPLTVAEKCRRYRAKKKRLAANPHARGHEWGTPIAIIEAVRAVLGEIDCDPATHAEAQERVQAACCYTAAADGLLQPWHGRVFLNPPYERGLIEMFVIKLLMECAAGRTTEAIVLVNAQTDTKWFQYLGGAASSECYHSGRVRFLNSDGQRGKPLVGQVIFYIGPNPGRFRAVFGKLGRLTRREENTIDAAYIGGRPVFNFAQTGGIQAVRPRAVSPVTEPAPSVTVADVVVTDTSDGVSVTKIRQ